MFLLGYTPFHLVGPKFYSLIKCINGLGYNCELDACILDWSEVEQAGISPLYPNDFEFDRASEQQEGSAGSEGSDPGTKQQ